tara:strand:+ start:5196 stop:5345 length:150 start_codon:yes stop_codon:yes gene_type:complete
VFIDIELSKIELPKTIVNILFTTTDGFVAQYFLQQFSFFAVCRLLTNKS